MRKLEDCKAEVFRRSEERIKERKRNRNRVLACCILLCMLLVAGGIYIQPLLQPVDELGRINAADGAEGALPDRELGGGVPDFVLFSNAIVYTSVEVTDGTGGGEVSGTITNDAEVAELCRLMVAYFGVPAKESAGTDGAADYSITGETNGTTATDCAMSEELTGTDGTTVTNDTVREETTVGQDRDTIYEDIKLKYNLEEKKADYKCVFQTKEGEEFVICLYGNVLYNGEMDCSVELSSLQLSVLKARLKSVTGDGSKE